MVQKEIIENNSVALLSTLKLLSFTLSIQKGGGVTLRIRKQMLPKILNMDSQTERCFVHRFPNGMIRNVLIDRAPME